MTMRRKERQVSDWSEIDAVIEECDCIRLGLTDDEGVYIVPLSFGYEASGGRRIFYFHGAREGRKARCIAAVEESGGLVTFEMDCAHGIKGGDTACKHSAYYKCVMGKGQMKRTEDNEAKRRAFDLIMAHNVARGEEGEVMKKWDIPDLMLSRVAIWALEVVEISCKEHMEK